MVHLAEHITSSAHEVWHHISAPPTKQRLLHTLHNARFIIAYVMECAQFWSVLQVKKVGAHNSLLNRFHNKLEPKILGTLVRYLATRTTGPVTKMNNKTRYLFLFLINFETLSPSSPLSSIMCHRTCHRPIIQHIVQVHLSSRVEIWTFLENATFYIVSRNEVPRHAQRFASTYCALNHPLGGIADGWK